MSQTNSRTDLTQKNSFETKWLEKSHLISSTTSQVKGFTSQNNLAETGL